MLNISHNGIEDRLDSTAFQSFGQLRKNRTRRFPVLFMALFAIIIIVVMFLPWTQNISGKGYVTTRRPSERPQTIQSVISGKVEQWYVKEGDRVEAGDTILYISEVKSDYFDPELLSRTSEQISAKEQSLQSYSAKIEALNTQYRALEEAMRLKIRQNENKLAQSRNKISMDSLDLVAHRSQLEIAENQLQRTRELYGKGLKSLTETQEKEMKAQQMRAKVSVQENKLRNQRNEWENLRLQRRSIQQEYSDKMAKSLSDKQSALAAKMDASAGLAKLRNQYSNYDRRQDFYYILAPQSGYITKTIKKGLGEIVKEGADVASITPRDYQLAVEIYVKPMDVPLLSLGDNTRLRFDGWPAVVISGWPEASTGVFSGEVVAIDPSVSDNGKYRVLISPEDRVKAWPEALRIGTGANTFILLRDVPIWYELWRQLNGFPPDFYKKKGKTQDVKLKAPIKSVK